MIFRWFLGNFKCFKLMFHIWGGFRRFKFFPISNLSQIRYRGGVIEFQIFPKFKKVQNFLGEVGGQEECGFFPLFVTFFNWNASLRRGGVPLLEKNSVTSTRENYGEEHMNVAQNAEMLQVRSGSIVRTKWSVWM